MGDSKGRSIQSPQHPRRSQGSGVWGWWLVLSVAIVIAFPYFEATRNANERPRIVQAMSLVETGQWTIDGPVRRRLDLGPDIARSPASGRLYPNKPPGTTLVLAPAVVLARAVHGDAINLRSLTWWARLMTAVVPSWVLIAVMLRRLSGRFGKGPGVAAVVLYMVATPAFSYAHLAYGHQLAACLLTLGLVAMVDGVDGVDGVDSDGGRTSWWRAALGGLLAASAVTVDYGVVFAGIPIALVLLFMGIVRGRGGRVVAAVAGAMLPIVALAWYHHAAFGSPWSTGYHHVIDPGFAAKHGQGLLGLSWPRWDSFARHMLHPGGGLLWWVPLAPLGLYGLVATAFRDLDERARLESGLFAAIVVLYVVLVACLRFDGGWRVGPRYLVAILPMLAWGWAEVLMQIHERPAWVIIVGALGGYSAAINVMAGTYWPHFDLTAVYQPWGEVLIPLWVMDVQPHGLLWDRWAIDGIRWSIVATVGLVPIAMASVIEVSTKMIVAVLVSVGAAVGLGWAVQAMPEHSRASANLAYIERVWEPAHDRPRVSVSRRLPPLTERQRRNARRGPVDVSPVR